MEVIGTGFSEPLLKGLFEISHNTSVLGNVL
jgi:hypothetical protein